MQLLFCTHGNHVLAFQMECMGPVPAGAHYSRSIWLRDPRFLPLMLKPLNVSAGCVGRQGINKALP